MAGVVEGGLLGLVVEVRQQPVEVAVYLLLLVLDLLVLCLALAAGELSALFVLEEVDQLPPALEVYLVLVVAHRPQALLGVVHFELTQVLKSGGAMLLGSVLHVFLGGSFLLRLVDVGKASSSVGWVSEAVDLDLAGLGLVLEEGFREIPRGKL